jgi:hypothetical protein
MGENEVVTKVFVLKPGGKRTFRGPRHRWEDNIKINLREVRIGSSDGPSYSITVCSTK